MKMKMDKSKKTMALLFIMLFSIGTIIYFIKIIGSSTEIYGTDKSSTQTDKSSSISETGTSTYYKTVIAGSRKVLNNVWGARNNELNGRSLKSYIYTKSDGSFGWEWNRPDPRPKSNSYVPPIYPEVIVGATPADSSSTTKVFPIRYGDINSWTSTIQFKYPKSPNGLYNLAYDIYWMDGDTKKFNVMIWIDGCYDGGSPIGEVSDGINTYIHYMREANDGDYWEWHAFELKDQGNYIHNVDIKALLDNAFSQGNIDNDWIVPGIELGSEIWRGHGSIQINKYNMTMNGHLI